MITAQCIALVLLLTACRKLKKTTHFQIKVLVHPPQYSFSEEHLITIHYHMLFLNGVFADNKHGTSGIYWVSFKFRDVPFNLLAI